jgi:hypothetical protein
MSENKRSFWASVPGLVTGLAGLLTGVVGLITLLVQLNVIGGDKSKTVATTATTVAGSPTTIPGGGGTTVTTVEPATFALSPPALDFPPSDPQDKFVTVKNTGKTVLTVSLPTVDGESPKAFLPGLGTCGNGPLAVGLSCTIKVTFTPPAGILSRYNATLQVRASEARAGIEVKLTGSTIL